MSSVAFDCLFISDVGVVDFAIGKKIADRFNGRPPNAIAWPFISVFSAIIENCPSHKLGRIRVGQCYEHLLGKHTNYHLLLLFLGGGRLGRNAFAAVG